ncbi:MAG: ParB/RepB/Spo0J family partition protein [Bacillota bacterium]
MASKEILGRNILDLIEENKVKPEQNERIQNLPVSDIRPNPNQPRVVFKKESLDELAKSIKNHGLIQPIIVKKDGGIYTLVAGERRLRAFKSLGKATIPAIIRDYNSIYSTEIALLENLQRENLTVIEEAVAYERVIKKLNLKHSELADKIGKSRSYVTNMLGLLSLPLNVIEALNNGELSMGHARILSKIDNEELVLLIANKIKNEGLSVRQTEALVREKKSDGKKVTSKHIENAKERAELKKYLEKEFNQRFGSKPKVSLGEKQVTLKFDTAKQMLKALKHYKGEK